MTICIADSHYFELKITRKNIKNAYIRVRPNKVLEVSAPIKLPYEFIAEFIKEKSKWIISVSNTLEDDFRKPVNLMPLTQEELIDLRFEAEDMVADALEKTYFKVKPYGVRIPEVRVRYMTSRWGSCIVNKGRVWINIYLAKLPPKCMEYVMLHELVHFIHPNHSADFYAMLEKLMPNWKEYKELLKRVNLPPKNAVETAVHINV